MKITPKTIFISIAGFILIIAGYFAGIAQAQRTRLPAQGYLQSTGAFIQIGIWDKQGVSKSNSAVFIVTDAGGKKYEAKKTDPLDNWVYATFPDDFTPYLDDTTVYRSYSWTAVVDGKTVGGGKFKWGNGQADDNNRNLK